MHKLFKSFILLLPRMDLEKKPAAEEIEITEEASQTEPEEKDVFGSSTTTKNILILIGVTVVLFAAVITSFKVYNGLTSAGVATIDELHQENLEGTLEDIEGYVYNGFSFVKADGLWWTEINKFGTRLKIPLHFAPKELESLEMRGNLNPAFNDGDDVYMAINPNVANQYYSLALSELNINLVKGMNRRPVATCTEEHEVCTGREIVNCENANGRPVIQLELSEPAGVEFIDTCIKIKGIGFDLVKSANKVLYYWYGIMKKS